METNDERGNRNALQFDDAMARMTAAALALDGILRVELLPTVRRKQ